MHPLIEAIVPDGWSAKIGTRHCVSTEGEIPAMLHATMPGVKELFRRRNARGNAEHIQDTVMKRADAEGADAEQRLASKVLSIIGAITSMVRVRFAIIVLSVVSTEKGLDIESMDVYKEPESEVSLCSVLVHQDGKEVYPVFATSVESSACTAVFSAQHVFDAIASHTTSAS